MLNTEEYKLFLENNCLLCKKYKGTSNDNCGTSKRIEIAQHLEVVAAEDIFPFKDLKEVPHIQKYSCKKLDSKEVVEVKKIEKVNDKLDQVKMF